MSIVERIAFDVQSMSNRNQVGLLQRESVAETDVEFC
jgi:hypothetical protein